LDALRDFSIRTGPRLNFRRSQLGSFDLDLNVTHGQVIACCKPRLIEWLAVMSGAGGPASHGEAFALAKNQTMQWLNSRLLDAYIATWAGSNRGFAFSKVHDVLARRISAYPQTKSARGTGAGRFRFRLWLNKQHRIAVCKGSSWKNLGRARNLHAPRRHFADTSM
jgi:hypothetical protein